MYFLAHLYVILKALPDNFPKDLIKPLIIGGWNPDASYFPCFSWQLKIFNHQKNPPINFYKDSRKRIAFIKGWLVHMHCDEIIHEKPFFKNQQPLCPNINKTARLSKYLMSARMHLGREIGFDLYIYQNYLPKEQWITKIVKEKKTYVKPEVGITGYKSLQRYIYLYVNRILPVLAQKNWLSKGIRKIIGYELYTKTSVKEKAKVLLKETQKSATKIIKKK